jgi:hypothetical protein
LEEVASLILTWIIGFLSIDVEKIPFSHTAMEDQALKDERVLKGLAELLLDEGDRR